MFLIETREPDGQWELLPSHHTGHEFTSVEDAENYVEAMKRIASLDREFRIIPSPRPEPVSALANLVGAIGRFVKASKDG